LRFLVDTQLPRALVAWIQSEGHEAIHVFEIGLAQGKDSPIWQYAGRENTVIVSKDDDFAKMGSSRPFRSESRVAPDWKCINPTLIFWISARWPEIINRLDRGDRLVEVL
jgi:hypothetical protein